MREGFVKRIQNIRAYFPPLAEYAPRSDGKSRAERVKKAKPAPSVETARAQLPLPPRPAGAETTDARYADARSILAERNACERAPNINSISISPPSGVLFGVRRS